MDSISCSGLRALPHVGPLISVDPLPLHRTNKQGKRNKPSLDRPECALKPSQCLFKKKKSASLINVMVVLWLKNVLCIVPTSCSFYPRVELGVGRASPGRGFFLKNHFGRNTYSILPYPKVIICKHPRER